MFSCKSDMTAHVQQVHRGGPKPYECTSCGKHFANASYLSQHLRIHQGLKPYCCQLCDRRFTQLCHLQQHVRTHTGEKPYRCRHPGCAKAFSQLSNLQSHTRSHMSDRPFRCNSCYKCFADERDLADHIPRHNETKHLKTKICTVCGKSYAQETYLARHMAKHQQQSAANGIAPPRVPHHQMYRSQSLDSQLSQPLVGGRHHLGGAGMMHELMMNQLTASCGSATSTVCTTATDSRPPQGGIHSTTPASNIPFQGSIGDMHEFESPIHHGFLMGDILAGYGFSGHTLEAVGTSQSKPAPRLAGSGAATARPSSTSAIPHGPSLSLDENCDDLPSMGEMHDF